MQPAHSSSTARYLVGKQLAAMPSDQTPTPSSPVRTVIKRGSKRIVMLANGTQLVFSKQQLVNRFNATLQKNQARMSLRSVREAQDLRATAKIGGRIRGHVKSYVSKAAAIRAIKRAYPKAKL